MARRLTSWDEYQSVYGSFLPNGHLPYSVKGFFETGGDTCYVVRVAATRPVVPRGPTGQGGELRLPPGPAQGIGALAGSGGASAAEITLTPPNTPAALVGAQIVVAHAA